MLSWVSSAVVAALVALGMPTAPAHAQPPYYVEFGEASYYSNRLTGRKTASGTRFDPNAMTAAHRDLPLGTSVWVTNLETGQAVRVTINDRGPFVEGRIIDLSRRAAQALGIIADGVAYVRVEAWPEAIRAARRAGR